MTPKYQQLANTLKQDIKTRLKPGDRMASQRELMNAYGLSFTTVDNALKLLVNDGLLVRLQGKGTFVNSIEAKDKKPTSSSIYIFSALSMPGRAHALVDGYLSILYSAIRNELVDTGINLSFATFINAAPEQIARHEGFDAAILIAPTDEYKELVKQFEISHIPTVVIGAEWPDIDLPLVDSDNEEGICRAVELLAGHGHRRICYIDRHAPTVHSEIRRQAFFRQAEKLNLAVKDEWCINMSFNRLDDNNRADIRRIFTQDERPTAVMFSSLYTSAMLVISELKSLGLRLPEDVSIIGFDDPAWASCTEPPITVIKQPLEEIGCRAVKMLLSQLEGKIYTRREILKDELIERESIAQI